MFLSPPFPDRPVTLEVCSEELAKGVLVEVQSLLLDHGFSKQLNCTWLARTQDGENDKNRRYYALAKFYAPDKVAKTPKEKELEAAMGKLQRATHFKYVIQLQDEYARLINPRAVRSSVAVIESESASPQQFHSDKAGGDSNAWSHAVHSHCFSTLMAIGKGVQSLNYIVENNARQLQLPPGVAVFLGPQAVHAGSSTDGIRIHCTYDVQDLDAYDVHVNCYEKNGTKWPDYHSDSNLERVPWYEEALKVVRI